MHFGRKDLQVKVRGYRLEVIEVEMALINLAMIEEAVVVARDDQDQPGEQYLVAYLVQPTSYHRSIGHELRNPLKEKLPEYMVPSAFVFLEGLPLYPMEKWTGAPSEPGGARPDLATTLCCTKNASRESVSSNVGRSPRAQQVGVHDNFFDLGGQLSSSHADISKVLKTLQVELPVRSFFEVPTVAGVAKLIETIRWTRQGQQGSIESTDEREQGDL